MVSGYRNGDRGKLISCHRNFFSSSVHKERVEVANYFLKISMPDTFVVKCDVCLCKQECLAISVLPFVSCRCAGKSRQLMSTTFHWAPSRPLLHLGQLCGSFLLRCLLSICVVIVVRWFNKISNKMYMFIFRRDVVTSEVASVTDYGEHFHIVLSCQEINFKACTNCSAH